MTTHPDITDDQIEQLRAEAGTAGDLAQVAMCTRALDGDTAAIAGCARAHNRIHQAMEAKAILIDAAPDLLRATKALLRSADHTLPREWQHDRPVSLARAAIAKAEGSTSIE